MSTKLKTYSFEDLELKVFLCDKTLSSLFSPIVTVTNFTEENSNGLIFLKVSHACNWHKSTKLCHSSVDVC